MLSYASRAQSSRLPRVDWTSQKISRKVSRFEYRYSSVGSEVGSSIPFLPDDVHRPSFVGMGFRQP
jgi:hypothetical protein